MGKTAKVVARYGVLGAREPTQKTVAHASRRWRYVMAQARKDPRPKLVAIGCDEAGFDLKEAIKDDLASAGYEVKDFGCYSKDPIDYPDIAFELADAVARGEHERGILICGTGIGMAISANKVPGVRAAQVHDAYSAERARKSNDAQVMTMGARVIGTELARSLVHIWLASEFEGGRSQRKVDKIRARDRDRGGDR
jgi:ribose 5-phosphate isomerase B